MSERITLGPLDLRRSLMLLLLLWLGHCAANVAWIRADRTFRSYDMGPHLQAVMLCHEVLERQGLVGALRVLRGGEERVTWPSAAYLPWAVMAATFGHGLDHFRIYNLFFVALLLLGAFLLGRALSGNGAGLVAAALVGLLPVIYGEGRSMGLDLAGAALATLAVALLVSSQGMTRAPAALLFGLTLGLCALTRPQSALLVGPPAAVACVWGALRPRPRLRPLGLGLAALGLGLAVSAVWWWGRVPLIVADFVHHYVDQQNDAFVVKAPPSALWDSLHYWATSLAAHLRVTCSPYLLPWLLAGVGLALVRYRRDPRFWVVGAWAAVQLAYLALISVPALRYCAPLAVGVASLAALGLCAIRRPRLRAAAVAAVLLLGLGAMLWDSFGSPPQQEWFGYRDDPTKVGVRMIYVTSGPPRRAPELVDAEQVALLLRRRHGDGAGLVIRPLPDRADYLWWRVRPLLAVNLSGVRFAMSRLRGPKPIEPRGGYQPVGGASVPTVAAAPPRHCYVLAWGAAPGGQRRPPTPAPPPLPAHFAERVQLGEGAGFTLLRCSSCACVDRLEGELLPGDAG